MRANFLLLVTILFINQAFCQIGKYSPKSNTNQIIKHSAYWLSYSEHHEQAEWVFYKLSHARKTGSVDRKDNFREDPKVSTRSATLADYKGSGYDRGHLCPAGDNKNSSTAMSESFYMSNMSPQEPGFNRGIWKRLESQFRDWSTKNSYIYVVTAGVLTSSKGTIGPNNVAIPRYYYKIALNLNPETKAIGFLMPNVSSKKALSDYVVTVDSIETLTGIDFFYQINNQDTFEGLVDLDYWDVDNTTSSSSGGSAIQCKGIAKSTGIQCKNKTKNANRYCHLHQSQAN